MKLLKKLIALDIICFLVFTFILVEVLANRVLINSDISINLLMSLVKNNLIIDISKLIGVIFDTLSIVVISLILLIYFWFKYSKKDSLFFMLVILLSTGLIFLVKELVQRARPFNALVSETSFSFPSGHATSAVVFFGLLIYLFIIKNKSFLSRSLFTLICFILILIIGFSRLILNVHWFSDVIGGFFLGLFILISCVIIREILNKG